MDKWTIIILGATGDLSKSKLIPALYNGIQKGATAASDFLFIGAAYEDVSIDQVIEQACPYIENCDDIIKEHFKKCSSYCQIDFDANIDFVKLKKHIEEQGKAHGISGKRLVYCSISPDYFDSVTKGLIGAGIIERDNLDHRIAYEKPFGQDLKSAKLINKSIKELLNFNQVYRIDHYLTKELVNNIVVLRFTNTMLQNVWDNKSVERVEIVINESVSAQGRKFYDRYGALKDVVQNHLLQLLALTAMERPDAITFEHMSQKKAEVLKSVTVEESLFGQYDGYISEEGVAKDSKTNTFVKLRLSVDTQRWKGVPFYIQTGKCLEQKQTEIRIIFKQVGECFITGSGTCENNKFIIRIQPDEGISLQVNVREPHDCRDELCRVSSFGLVPVKLDFCHSCEFGPYTPQAYEILLQSIIAGDTEIGVSAEEIEAQWAIIEQVEAMNTPLYIYQKGSHGPHKPGLKEG